MQRLLITHSPIHLVNTRLHPLLLRAAMLFVGAVLMSSCVGPVWPGYYGGDRYYYRDYYYRDYHHGHRRHHHDHDHHWHH